MKLYKVRGGTRENFLNKKYNIAIGASLGNKWFTVDNIIKLVKFILPYVKEHLIIYVADTIHAINIEIRSGRSAKGARKKACKMREDLIKAVKGRVSEELSPEEQQHIYYKMWDDLRTDDYQSKLDYLYDKYNTDAGFRKTILNIINGFLAKESRTFSDSDKEKMGTYIIEELPEMLNRFPIEGLKYDANAYPHDTAVTKLAEDIQRKIKFPEIANKIIDSGNRVFLEIR